MGAGLVGAGTAGSEPSALHPLPQTSPPATQDVRLAGATGGSQALALGVPLGAASGAPVPPIPRARRSLAPFPEPRPLARPRRVLTSRGPLQPRRRRSDMPPGCTRRAASLGGGPFPGPGRRGPRFRGAGARGGGACGAGVRAAGGAGEEGAAGDPGAQPPAPPWTLRRAGGWGCSLGSALRRAAGRGERGAGRRDARGYVMNGLAVSPGRLPPGRPDPPHEQSSVPLT